MAAHPSKSGFLRLGIALVLFLVFIALLNLGIRLTSANSIQYVYDSLNRLIEVRYPDKVIHYTYDAAGNRTGVTVEILIAAPSISSLSPRGAVVGGNVFTLKINGSNFTNNSVVQWNGENRPTTFISANELRITVNSSDIIALGTASVVVVNPSPSLSVSNAQTFSVVQNAAFSGQITSGGNALSNVTINLTGAESESVTTDINGNFNFAVLNNGSYTITPGRTNYTFSPASRTVNYSGVSQTNLNFTGSLVSYSISGRVANGNGTGIAGVAIGLSGSQTGQTTTDSNGNYSLSAIAEGNYTITPSLAGYTFNPTNLSFTNLSANQTGNFTAVQLTRPALFDFDGDRKTDISIFRPGSAEWWHLRSSDNTNRAVQFGSTSDKIVPADYTGDGKTDIAFWRPSTGEWFIIRSEDNSFFAFPFGSQGDKPVPADFDGDGKADPTVFRPSNSVWYTILSGGGGVTFQQFGISEDIPLPNDYDGDGKADFGVFRPTPSEWWILKSTGTITALQFGSTGDKPVPGDFTGDGKVDVAFWRPSTGFWYILRSEDNTFYAYPFGSNADIPAPGDYDGDGKTDAAVFRPSNSVWYVQGSTSGVTATQFGNGGDIPIPSAYLP